MHVSFSTEDFYIDVFKNLFFPVRNLSKELREVLRTTKGRAPVVSLNYVCSLNSYVSLFDCIRMYEVCLPSFCRINECKSDQRAYGL